MTLHGVLLCMCAGWPQGVICMLCNSLAFHLLLDACMKRSFEAIAPSHERPLIIKVGEQVDLAAMAEADSEPVALYYRSNVAVTAFPLRTVMLIVLFIGCGGILAYLIRLSMQGVAQVFLRLAGL
jgi:hypothetical protein